MSLSTVLKVKLKSMLGDPAAKIAAKAQQQKWNSLAICAMGEIGQHVLGYLKDSQPEGTHFYLYDSKAEYNQFSVMGLPVRGLHELKNIKVDAIVIASEKFQDEIMAQIKEQTGCSDQVFICLNS